MTRFVLLFATLLDLLQGLPLLFGSTFVFTAVMLLAVLKVVAPLM